MELNRATARELATAALAYEAYNASIGGKSAITGAETHLNTIVTQLLVGRESRYPHVTAATQSALTESGQEQALEFGLNLILDGLGARVRAKLR